uniref:Uncharacterized protein n=1 Tax=Rhizophora mucronata TaxID=61149 RepID=A0A2P2P506_RHIMU
MSNQQLHIDPYMVYSVELLCMHVIWSNIKFNCKPFVLELPWDSSLNDG